MDNISNRKNNPHPKELFISKALIVFGIYSAIFFLLWLLDASYRQDNFLYVIIILSFAYKLILLITEWLLIWHPSVPDKVELKRKFTVDVLTTYVKGEPKEMVKNSLLAIKSMTYPHETFLCDEADDAELKAFCNENKIHHVTREKKINAKAGNINNALETVACGEIVLILDPDHVVYPNFLDEVLPYFEDDKMGFVQVVQAYYNQYDTVIAKAAAEQTYQFYGPVMMTLNSYGAVPAIGANCTFRRTALDSIGGHAPGLTEDMHTTLRLKAKGWKSVYNPVIVAKGLVPWNYSGYSLQQLKWSRGSFDLLFNVFPKVAKNLSWAERLAFLTVPMFYLSGIVALFDFLIPILALLLGWIPIHVSIFDFFIYYTPLFVISQVIRFYHQKWYFEEHEKGTAILGGVLFKSTWWATMLGFLYSLVNKKVPYIPTPKDSRIETPWRLLIPNFTVIAVSVFAIIYGLKQDFTPFTLFMAFLAFLNIAILSFGNLMAMQKQIVAFHKLFQGSPVSKDSATRRFLFKQKNVVYSLFSKNVVVFLLLLFVVLTNVFIIGITPERFQRGIKTNYIGRKVSEIFGNKTLIYNKDYWQIYTGVNYKSGMKISKMPVSFIKRDFYLNQMTEVALNRFMDSCYSNNILPFLALSVDTSGVTLGSGQRDKLKLVNVLEEVKKRYLPLFIMFDRNLTPVSDDVYAGIYRKSFHLADSIAVRSLITWVWHSKDIDSDYWLGYYNYYEEFLVDWIYAENDTAFFVDKTYYGKEREGMYKPLLLDAANINKIEKTSLDEDKYGQNIVGILGSGPIKSTKLKYNFSDSFEKPIQSNAQRLSLPNYVKGIAYNPGQGSGNSDKLPPTAKKLKRDFALIEDMGCNTIRLFTSSIYDYNILKAAKEVDLDVLYGFNLMHHSFDFLRDSTGMDRLKKEILRQVQSHVSDSSIIAWGLGNETWENLSYAFGQPYLSTVRIAYLQFLNDVIEDIKVIDDKRPVYTSETLNSSSMLAFSRYLPNMDFFGVNAYYKDNLKRVSELAERNLKGMPYLFTEYGNKGYWDLALSDFDEHERILEQTSMQKADDYISNWNNYIFSDKENNLGGVAFCWQDRFEETATWFGVIDIFGHKKPAYYALKEAYSGNKTAYVPRQFPIPEYKLLVKYDDSSKSRITASALIAKDNLNPALFQYKWIVYTDVSFYKIIETDFKEGLTDISFSLLDEDDAYRVYLYVKDDSDNVITESLPLSRE
ncbi:glycosyltransferase [Saccharicrinis sp. FJH62]|uniref:glycosyltransferase n=1 Tax=Saccharicrinis sp. FJH62 TaxID=3344657 RepID=UPI0035D3FCAF